MQLALSNVINIQVSQAPQGLGQYNTSNVAVFSDEIPAMSFGSLGYAIYFTPDQAAIDFGSDSRTFQVVNDIFSQQPNILANNGYVVVILMAVATQSVSFSGTPASGVFVLNYGAQATAAINWNDTASVIQGKLQALTGLSQVLVSGSIAGNNLEVQFAGVYGVQSLLTVTGDTLMTSAPAAVTVTVATVTAGETWAAAITRTKDLVQYFGLFVNEILSAIGQTDLLAAAAIVQPLNKIGFAVSNVEADILPGGMIDLLRTGSLTQMRGLYRDDTDASATLDFMADYVGRALSTNFGGSNTTQTMHLKDLIGLQPDPNITQTILNAAIAAGADTYISIQGVPKVFCSGANKYFDQVYNLQWFVGALQVAGFNYLATTSTKVPQTESGMDGLKGAYRQVCEQGITNQYGAPGQWNSSTTFGNQQDFLNNIAQRGYYIYSVPIAQQAQSARVARQAPLVQIAFKEAGAIQSSTVIVNINA